MSKKRRGPHKREYKLFLLRMWRDTPEDSWRISIQPNDQSKQIGIATLDALLAFMQDELAGNLLADVSGNREE